MARDDVGAVAVVPCAPDPRQVLPRAVEEDLFVRVLALAGGGGARQAGPLTVRARGEQRHRDVSGGGALDPHRAPEPRDDVVAVQVLLAVAARSAPVLE